MNIKAYAKLNLTLDITGKREDGYHVLSSIMQEVSLCDDISILVKNGKGQNEIKIKCLNSDIPCGEENTCYKAVKFFFERYGIENKLVKINIKKGIPDKAGMGGGSADAAAVIKALNKMLGIEAPDEDLEAVAIKVGADVPFFIKGGLQKADGIGEKLTPLKSNRTPYFVVAMPHKAASTKEVYDAFDGIEEPVMAGTEKFLNALEFNINPYEYMSNSLTDAAMKVVPEIKSLIELLSQTSQNVCMTGSGSAVFAVYGSYSQAFEVVQKYKKDLAFAAVCVGVESSNL